MEQEASKRHFQRYPFSGVAEVSQGGRRCGWGTVTEVGRGGCYIENQHPLAVGAEVQLRITSADDVLEVDAVVVWVTPQVGMGIRFNATTPEAQDAMDRLLKNVAGEHRVECPLMDAQRAELPPSCSAELRIGEIAIRQEAAPDILAKIVRRIDEAGSLTRHELIEIVNNGQ